MGKNPDTNYTNLHELKDKTYLWHKLIAFVLLVLIGAQNLAPLHAFTNHPSKPPVGARIDPLHHINRGLVAWWLFNDGAGSTLNDITGRYHGTLINMDANDWVGSPRGGALDFDGSDDYVITETIDAFAGSFSVSAWVKYNSLTKVYSTIMGVGNFRFSITASATGAGTVWINNGGAVGFSSLTTGTWYHIVYTHDIASNTGRVYLNGVYDSAGTAPTVTGNTTFYIGKQAYGDTNIDGQIDEVRVYNRVLFADEVAELYRNTLVGLWQRPVKWYGVASFTPTVTWW